MKLVFADGAEIPLPLPNGFVLLPAGELTSLIKEVILSMARTIPPQELSAAAPAPMPPTETFDLCAELERVIATDGLSDEQKLATIRRRLVEFYRG